LGKALSDFFEEFPFATAEIIAQHFNQSKPIIKEILQQELELQRFSRRWVPYSLSNIQKVDWTAMATDLLSVLYRQADYSFSPIVTGDESWFLYLYLSDHMFTASRDNMIAREKATIKAQSVILTIFFSGVSLITVDALLSGAQFTQEYFINNILLDIVETRGRIFRRVRRGEFFVHMNNSMCHNGYKVTDELPNLKLDRVPHPPYSQDLSLCDFWLFVMLKQKIKDRVFQMVEEIMIAVHKVWDELTLDDLQSVFFNWIERFG
jgi:hypothetical protein